MSKKINMLELWLEIHYLINKAVVHEARVMSPLKKYYMKHFCHRLLFVLVEQHFICTLANAGLVTHCAHSNNYVVSMHLFTLNSINEVAFTFPLYIYISPCSFLQGIYIPGLRLPGTKEISNTCKCIS